MMSRDDDYQHDLTDSAADTHDASAVAHLINLLHHHDDHVRLEAVKAIEQAGYREALIPLYRLWYEPGHNHLFLEEPLKALKLIANKNMSYVSSLMDSSLAETRECAASILGLIKNHRAIEILLQHAHDANFDVRISVAYALRLYRSRKLKARLQRELRDDASKIDMAFVLAFMKDLSIIPMLENAVAAQDVFTRMLAAHALGRLETTQVLGILEKLLDDSMSCVRAQAIFAIRMIYFQEHRCPDELIRKLINYLDDESAEVRSESVQTLGFMDRYDVRPHLLVRLEDVDPEVRIAAIRSLFNFREHATEEDINAVVKCLYDANPGVRATALDQLCELGDIPLRSRVLEIAEHDDDEFVQTVRLDFV